MKTTRALLTLLASSIDADENVHRTPKDIQRRLDTMTTNQDRINAAADAITELATGTAAAVDTLQEKIAAEFAELRAAIAENGDAALAAAADKFEAALAKLSEVKSDVENTPVEEAGDDGDGPAPVDGQ